MKKAEIRELIFNERKTYSLDYLAQSSNRISDLFFKNFKELEDKTIHIFIPIVKKAEIDTWIIINRIFLEYPKVKLCTSIVDYSTGELEHFLFNKETKFAVDKWGISIPTSINKIAEQDIDIVLTPLLAYDSKGYRVGYGKGFYDKFFSRCTNNTQKIGLCVFEDGVIIDDVNEYDMALDYCITPTKLVSFSK